MSTGGAAKGVMVPPMETLTKSAPRVAYLRRVDTGREKMRSDSIMAARVMAAGSVMNEPSSGAKASTAK